MHRSLDSLATGTFDVAVVGGGILGSFVALLAQQRGFRVALIEKNDFASGTTGGSGRVLHGGIRYLQSLRLSLAWHAQREQKLLARMAPRLVRALPFFVPSRNGLLKEQAMLRAGALAWRAFCDMTRSGLQLPRTRFAGSRQSGELASSIAGDISGGMLFFDVQLRSPERFCFELVRAAAENGATVANHLEAVGLRAASGRVAGLEARDRISGQEIEIEAPLVVNAAGAWTPELVAEQDGGFPAVAFGKGIHVILDRPEPEAALALPYSEGGTDSPGAQEERRVFLMPWEGFTLVGASYEPFQGGADAAGVSGVEVHRFLAALTNQWPTLRLDQCDVLYAYSGLYPVFGRKKVSGDRYVASLRPLLVDHAEQGGPRGLFSAMTVKLTTARELAEEVVGMLTAAASTECSVRARAAGGLQAGAENRSPNLETKEPAGDLGDRHRLPDLAAHAAEDEMALRLADVLFRRTWIGHKGPPERTLLERSAKAMAGPLGWSTAKQRREVDEILEFYERWRGPHRDSLEGSPEDSTIS